MSSTKKVWQKIDTGSSYIDQRSKRDSQGRYLMQKHTIAPLLAEDSEFLCLSDDDNAGVMPFKIKYCLLTRMELKRKEIGLNRLWVMALMYALFGCGGSAVVQDPPADNG